LKKHIDAINAPKFTAIPASVNIFKPPSNLQPKFRIQGYPILNSPLALHANNSAGASNATLKVLSSTIKHKVTKIYLWWE
jgi:hypothetical protein